MAYDRHAKEKNVKPRSRITLVVTLCTPVHLYVPNSQFSRCFSTLFCFYAFAKISQENIQNRIGRIVSTFVFISSNYPIFYVIRTDPRVTRIPCEKNSQHKIGMTVGSE